MEPEFIQRRLTREEINELPLVHYEGPVVLVRSRAVLEKALPDLRAEPVLGFDTETKPSFRKGTFHLPSLIQLATASCVYLVQLVHLPLCGPLTDLFVNPDQIKAGVGILEDMRELQPLRTFEPAGCADLSLLAEKHNISSRGLRSLVASFFGQRISKGPQCSNWSLPTLSQWQISYAATDAWMGRRLYLRMRELGLTETP